MTTPTPHPYGGPTTAFTPNTSGKPPWELEAQPEMAPYGDKGSGWSGSDTSRERAEHEDAAGITGWRQREVFEAVQAQRSEGVTVMEVERQFNLGHGPASSALTHLHRAGHVRRLKMRRGKQEIYVAPDFVNGRDESPYRPRGYKHPRQYSRDEWRAAAEAAGLTVTVDGVGSVVVESDQTLDSIHVMMQAAKYLP